MRISEIIVESAKCNMKCKYCFGDYYGDKNGHYKPIPFNREFFEKNADKIDNDRITIWGGEPFYNFDIVKDIVDFFKDKVKRIHLPTNGVLFDMDKAKWCVENKITLQFSHDALSQNIRGADYIKSKEFQDAVGYYCEKTGNKISFHQVYTAFSETGDENIKFWEGVATNELAGIGFSVNDGIFRCSTDNGKPFKFDPDKLVEYFREKLLYVINGGKMRKLFEGSIYSRVLRPYLITSQRKIMSYDECMCGMSRRFLNGEHVCYGTSGSVYICHSDCERLSGFGEDGAKQVKQKMKKCALCPFIRFCFGACIGTFRESDNDCDFWHSYYDKLIMMVRDVLCDIDNDKLGNILPNYLEEKGEPVIPTKAIRDCANSRELLDKDSIRMSRTEAEFVAASKNPAEYISARLNRKRIPLTLELK